MVLFQYSEHTLIVILPSRSSPNSNPLSESHNSTSSCNRFFIHLTVETLRHTSVPELKIPMSTLSFHTGFTVFGIVLDDFVKGEMEN